MCNDCVIVELLTNVELFANTNTEIDDLKFLQVALAKQHKLHENYENIIETGQVICDLMMA
jgi:hypothetical protein